MTPQTFLFAVYLVAGPGLWILFIVGMTASRGRMRLLQKSNVPIPEPFPEVTIIVPAKDERERIEQCLSSVLARITPHSTCSR
jgi:hypothetical protein